MDVGSQIMDICRLYAPCQDLCSTKYTITLLGLAGRSVSLSDVGPSDLAAKETLGLETITYSTRLSIRHCMPVC